MSANRYSKPKRPAFADWLRTSGQITATELYTLTAEWNRIKSGAADYRVYTTEPTTWDQFVASKYPRKVLAYQAYLRLIGAAPTFNKD